MGQRVNPFHDLYLTEAIGPDQFVRLFSPQFVGHATSLFQPGNVVLRGLQGSGKTMLLNLLKPEVRIAYARAKTRFPVPREHGRFLGAGINLRKSGVMDFGNLILPNTPTTDPLFITELALQFGDFLNYWIAADLLETISIFSKCKEASLLGEIGLQCDAITLDSFACKTAKDACWFGYLEGIETFDELRRKMASRIVTYRKLVNLNLPDDKLPDEIARSKSVIGDPIARLAECLRQTGVLHPEALVFIRIDQYEQLPTLDTEHCHFGSRCQEITHKALAARDSRVAYRIGTRQYAWPDSPIIFGTVDSLENRRDFSVVDIDEKLRRKENPRTWIFPRFARDIFNRRLQQGSYSRPDRSEEDPLHQLEKIFGNSPSSEDRAAKYVSSRNSTLSYLDLGKDAPKGWRTFLEDLAKKSPLGAKFADAWVRQKGSEKAALRESPPEPGKFPWDGKVYWKKERTELALLQIASANRQQPIWAGVADILGLSGGNILVFLSICQHIWDAWLRDTRDAKGMGENYPTNIAIDVQSQGIRETSEEWVGKLREGADASQRAAFTKTLGQYFYKRLIDDRAMSNPGSNGFSINAEHLHDFPELKRILRTCVAYGDLYEAPHTSKKMGERRLKYYLAPILCPYFKIPYTHTKEPEYVTPVRVQAWITDGGQRSNTKVERPEQQKQLKLDLLGQEPR